MLACCAVAAVLAGCSTTVWKSRTPSAERREQYVRYAGAPVDSIARPREYYTWTPLGNDQLVLWTSVNDAYLITVLPPCAELDFVRGIRITTTGNTVTRGVDSIQFLDRTCLISQLRPVDYAVLTHEANALP